MRDLPGPLGVLAMGDGSARRTVKAPGYLDEAAVPFDTAVAAALAAGDAGALAALDEARGRRGCSPPGCRPGGRSAPRWPAGTIRARLHLHDAPFGVGYLAAAWTAT